MVEMKLHKRKGIFVKAFFDITITPGLFNPPSWIKQHPQETCINFWGGVG